MKQTHGGCERLTPLTSEEEPELYLPLTSNSEKTRKRETRAE